MVPSTDCSASRFWGGILPPWATGLEGSGDEKKGSVIGIQVGKRGEIVVRYRPQQKGQEELVELPHLNGIYSMALT
jgi:hypothetical protein